MNKEIDISVYLSILKEEIQIKYGKRILYANDCHVLSEEIIRITKRQVSTSTLKRFFGIIKYPFSPSKYTLDTLSVFLEYEGWQDYKNNHQKQKHFLIQDQTWDNLKTEANLITEYSFKSIKDRIGSAFKNFPIRKFAKKNIDEFLASEKTATAFISPAGYGKSTFIAQITEDYFYGETPKYPNDIVCLVDGNIFYNLLFQNPKADLLQCLVDYKPSNNISTIFRNTSELVKGRYLLIIDGLDEIHQGSDKNDHFADNLLRMISSFEGISFFKLIITCSPQRWRTFTYQVQNNPKLKLLWHNVIFKGSDDDIVNVPLLKKKEIKSILEKYKFAHSIEELYYAHPNILEIINKPYLLHLFLMDHKKRRAVQDIDILNHYIQEIILSPPYPDEKYQVIKAFFDLCGQGMKGTEVNKKDLHLSASKNKGYSELIRTGILYEYSFIERYLTRKTYVKFSHNILFAYYLVNILINENGLNPEFIKSILTKYDKVPHLQSEILKFIVKILFRDEKVDILKNIFSIIEELGIPEKDSPLDKACTILSKVLGVEMRVNKNLRRILIPYFAQSEAGRKYYFERYYDIDCLVLYSGNDLNYYLHYNLAEETIQYTRYLKFMQYFLAGNKEQYMNEYAKILIQKFKLVRSSLGSAYYYIPQVIAQAVNEKKVDVSIMSDIYILSETFFQDGTQSKTDIPHLEFAIIFSLDFGRLNNEIINLSNYVFQNYNLSNIKQLCFYQLFLSVYARALLETGETEKALEVYSQVNLNNINLPEYMKYYVKIRLLLIKSEFLIYKGKKEKAMHLLEKIKTISKMLKFNYFYKAALENGV